MALRLKEIAALIGGEVVGDGEIFIERVAPIETAGPGEITFVSNEKYTGFMQTTRAAAIIVSPQFRNLQRNLVVTPNPYLGFARTVGALMEEKPTREPGVHPTATISPRALLGRNLVIGPCVVVEEEAALGDNVTIMAGVYIGRRVTIGEDTIIYPNTAIYHGARIGKRCIIHANVTIGSDGFGFAPVDMKKHIVLEILATGRKGDGAGWTSPNVERMCPYERIPQVGVTAIGDDVSIGAGSIINRGGLGNTTIGRGTKIDSLVVISHNVEVGEDCLFVSQVGVSGSVKIGNHCSFGGQAGVAGHIKIGDNVQIAAQSGVSHDLAPNGTYFGSPARPIYEMKRTVAALHKLPELRDEIRHVQKQMDRITELLDHDIREGRQPAEKPPEKVEKAAEGKSAAPPPEAAPAEAEELPGEAGVAE